MLLLLDNLSAHLEIIDLSTSRENKDSHACPLVEHFVLIMIITILFEVDAERNVIPFR